MREVILETRKEIEARENVKVIHCVESGSLSTTYSFLLWNYKKRLSVRAVFVLLMLCFAFAQLLLEDI